MTTTLFEQAKQIESNCEDLQNEEAIGEQNQSLSHDYDLLEDKHTQWLEAHEQIQLFLKRKCLPDDPVSKDDLKKVKKHLTTVIEHFETDPTTLSQDKDLKKLTNGLNKLTETSRQAVNNAWEDWFKTKHPNPNARLLDTVETVLPEQQATVVAIRAHLAALENNIDTPPTDQSTWDTIEQHCHEATHKYTELVADFPEHVRDFCTRAADPDPQKGAPMACLTEEVKTWLQQHKLWDGLRIRLE
jgi:hypothetical protein